MNITVVNLLLSLVIPSEPRDTHLLVMHGDLT